MDIILRIGLGILAVWLIVTYLIPMLPAPFAMIATVIVVIAVIVWLLKAAGMWV